MHSLQCIFFRRIYVILVISQLNVVPGPLANALSRRFSARVVVFVGGLMFGTGCVLNAFATSTEYWIFTYTLMSGKIIFIFVWTTTVSDESQSR